jgi:hypothetical protein
LASSEQLSCISVVGSQKVPCQAQNDGFAASSMFPGLVTARLFLVSATKIFSERTTIRERRKSHCKSDVSTDRGIETSFQRNTSKNFTNVGKIVPAHGNHFEGNDFYLWVLHPVAHLSNWLFMMPSTGTKFQYVNSLFIFLLTHYMFRPIHLDILTFLHFLYMGPVFMENFNDFTIFIFVLSLITSIGDHGSKYRCKTYNIYTSSCVLETDPL